MLWWLIGRSRKSQGRGVETTEKKISLEASSPRSLETPTSAESSQFASSGDAKTGLSSLDAAEFNQASSNQGTETRESTHLVNTSLIASEQLEGGQSSDPDAALSAKESEIQAELSVGSLGTLSPSTAEETAQKQSAEETPGTTDTVLEIALDDAFVAKIDEAVFTAQIGAEIDSRVQIKDLDGPFHSVVDVEANFDAAVPAIDAAQSDSGSDLVSQEDTIPTLDKEAVLSDQTASNEEKIDKRESEGSDDSFDQAISQEIEELLIESAPVTEAVAVSELRLSSLDSHPTLPPKYRAPTSNPPRVRTPPSQAGVGKSEAQTRSLEVRLHAQMARTGALRISLLFKRLPGTSEACAATLDGQPIHLEAHGDEWYEATDLQELKGFLVDGLVVVSRSTVESSTQWILSAGRPFYVLAPQQGLSGFVSTARLQLGRRHLIVCLADWTERVANVLAEACDQPVSPNVDVLGIPEGWNVFVPIVPKRALPSSEGEDLLNLLKPLSDFDIVLDGGLRIQGNEWLVGFPPKINMAGERLNGQKVLIDKIVASCDAEGSYSVPEFDLPGIHQIWCNGRSLTYKIVESPTEWDKWDAHPKNIGTICGALASARDGSQHQHQVSVPSSNPVLIGAKPGEIFVCSNRNSHVWSGLTPFAPVWAVPSDPLHCRKATARVRLLNSLERKGPVQTKTRLGRRNSKVGAWCMAILDSRRKGLQTEPSDCRALWDEYVVEARRLWRTLN